MLLKDFDYSLPKELIAQKPIQPRDHSRLMVLNRQEQTITHDYFYNLDKYLRSGDMLVANNSKVIPARLLGRKLTGGQIEIFLLQQINDNNWQVLIKNCKVGDSVIFQRKSLFSVTSLSAEIIKQNADYTWEVHFSLSGARLLMAINQLGQTPTPPYIKTRIKAQDYQTVYAQVSGSVAAPTAGFHFTPQLIQKLSAQDIDLSYLTLHVGLGTFLPVNTEKIEDHHLHEEWAEVAPELAKKLNVAKKNHQRIVAIGTTSTRTLEHFASNGQLRSGGEWINLFIYPGYQFKFVDAMITNFHLPKSSLLMLVSAFACPELCRGTGSPSAALAKEGREFILRAYQEAINKKYRFYSFGEAMLIV